MTGALAVFAEGVGLQGQDVGVLVEFRSCWVRSRDPTSDGKDSIQYIATVIVGKTSQLCQYNLGMSSVVAVQL